MHLFSDAIPELQKIFSVKSHDNKTAQNTKIIQSALHQRGRHEEQREHKFRRRASFWMLVGGHCMRSMPNSTKHTGVIASGTGALSILCVLSPVCTNRHSDISVQNILGLGGGRRHWGMSFISTLTRTSILSVNPKQGEAGD